MVEIFEIMQDAHARVYEKLTRFHQAACQTNDIQVLANRAYALREIAKFAKDIEKEANKAKQMSERMACLVWAQGESNEPIRTQYCTASPVVKMMAVLPKKHHDPEAYAELMDHMGVSKEAQLTGGVRVHWPGMLDLISERLADGKPLPPGIKSDKTYANYSLTIRGKKGVDDD
jgi:hypothetical protein